MAGVPCLQGVQGAELVEEVGAVPGQRSVHPAVGGQRGPGALLGCRQVVGGKPAVEYNQRLQQRQELVELLADVGREGVVLLLLPLLAPFFLLLLLELVL